jgi:hypothetical protein
MPPIAAGRAKLDVDREGGEERDPGSGPAIRRRRKPGGRVTLARIGRFQVERTLGAGSFATVWLARDEDLDGWVAIKLLAENWSLNEDARRRFLEEARALRHLDNDRIVRVYEVGRLDDGRPYMVMEYADRGSLEDRMRLRAQLGERFNAREALDVSIELAECLMSVHASRIVHRDVKPSNVLFRSIRREQQEAARRAGRPAPGERMVLGDFGIARRLEGALAHTMVVGSPHYMSPEQGDPVRSGTADYRSDVYSAAAILYELLAGQVPLAFASVTELQRASPDRRAPSIRGIRADVPEHLAEAIHRGLAWEPAGRYATAWEWRDALIEARSALAASAGFSFAAPTGLSLGHPAAPASAAPPAVPPATIPARGHEKSTGAGVTRTVAAGTRRQTSVLHGAGDGGPSETSQAAVALPARPDAPQRETVGGGAVAHGSPGDGADEVTPVIRRWRLRQRLRVSRALIVVAGLAMAVGAWLPWEDEGSQGLLRRAGVRTTPGLIALGLGLLIVLAGVQLGRTPRRWVASVWALLAMVAGLAVMPEAVSAYVVSGLSASGRSSGPGPVVAAAAGLVAVVASLRAWRRLRWDRLSERHPALRKL